MQPGYVCRHETPARRLFRRALEAVPHNPAPEGPDLQQPIKLLFKWAHQEFKTDNLYQVPSAKFSTQANVTNVVDAHRMFISTGCL